MATEVKHLVKMACTCIVDTIPEYMKANPNHVNSRTAEILDYCYWKEKVKVEGHPVPGSNVYDVESPAKVGFYDSANTTRVLASLQWPKDHDQHFPGFSRLQQEIHLCARLSERVRDYAYRVHGDSTGGSDYAKMYIDESEDKYVDEVTDLQRNIVTPIFAAFDKVLIGNNLNSHQCFYKLTELFSARQEDRRLVLCLQLKRTVVSASTYDLIENNGNWMVWFRVNWRTEKARLDESSPERPDPKTVTDYLYNQLTNQLTDVLKKLKIPNDSVPPNSTWRPTDYWAYPGIQNQHLDQAFNGSVDGPTFFRKPPADRVIFDPARPKVQPSQQVLFPSSYTKTRMPTPQPSASSSRHESYAQDFRMPAYAPMGPPPVYVDQLGRPMHFGYAPQVPQPFHADLFGRPIDIGLQAQIQHAIQQELSGRQAHPGLAHRTSSGASFRSDPAGRMSSGIPLQGRYSQPTARTGSFPLSEEPESYDHDERMPGSQASRAGSGSSTHPSGQHSMRRPQPPRKSSSGQDSEQEDDEEEEEEEEEEGKPRGSHGKAPSSSSGGHQPPHQFGRGNLRRGGGARGRGMQR